MRQFVLQARDPATGHPVREARLRIEDMAALRRILGDVADNDPDVRHTYFLDFADAIAIGALSSPPFEPDAELDTLESWRALRSVPYLIHTEYELPLMLEGRKPLAAFADDPAWLTQYLKPFDPFVQHRRLVRRSLVQGDVLRVYFALPGQEWRIDAYIKMAQADTPRDDAYERREGELLGYEDWQNDWWIANRMSLRSAE